jgi:hypothetical protein
MADQRDPPDPDVPRDDPDLEAALAEQPPEAEERVPGADQPVAPEQVPQD